MKTKTRFKAIVPNLYAMSVYSEEIKAPMTTHVLVDASRLVLIDPVHFTDKDMEELGKLGVMDSILLTTQNHLRYTPQLREKYNVRVFVHSGAPEDVRKETDKAFGDLDLLPGELTSIHIPGTKPSETAFFLDRDGGVMIMGDALMNLDGLEFLPDKYCDNPATSRLSLKKLLVYDFKTMCFGHGDPVGGYPKIALRNLLEREAPLGRKKRK